MARARVPRRELDELCREHFSSVEMHGLFHARKLRLHELALSGGLGPRAPAAGG